MDGQNNELNSILKRYGSINVYGMGSKKKRVDIMNNIEMNGLVLVAVQETKDCAMRMRFPGWNSQFSRTNGNMIGVGFIWKTCIQSNILEVKEIIPSHMIQMTLQEGEDKIVILNLYLPTTRHANHYRNMILRKVRTIIMENRNSKFLISGDFNKQKGSSKKQIEELEIRFGLADVWPSLKIHERGPTHKQGGRLDRIYLSVELLQGDIDIDLVEVSFSDHFLLKLKQLDFGDQKKMNWKLPEWVISLKEFRKVSDDMAMKQGTFDGVIERWDELKEKWLLIARRMQKNRRNWMKARRGEVYRNVHKKILDEVENGADIHEEIQNAFIDYDFKAYHQVFDDESRWTNYDIRKKRPISRATNIYDVDKKKYIVSKEDKAEYAHRYFSNVFGKGNNILTNKVDYAMMNFKEVENMEDIGGEIKDEEIKQAIKNMKKNSAPGPDGIPLSFYEGSESIKKVLLKLFNEIVINENCPNSFSNSITVLIPKKEEKNDMSDFRPISLLNNDYKIFAKIIASRIVDKIQDNIGVQQCYAIKNRRMHHIIQILKDEIENRRKHRKRYRLLSIDMAKAFNTIDHGHIYIMLRKMGVPKSIVRTVMNPLVNAKTKVKVDNILTESIKIQRGVHQGDPLSAVLFIIAMEFNMIGIRDIIKRSNMRESSEPSMLFAYADDVVLIVQDNSEINDILEWFQNASRVTGMNLNVKKTKVIHCDYNEEVSSERLKYEVQRVDNIKLLGIVIGKMGKKRSFEVMMEKTKNGIAKIMFSLIRLPYRDRIWLINSFIVPHVLFFLGVYTMNAHQMKLIDNMLFNAFWLNKRHPHPHPQALSCSLVLHPLPPSSFSSLSSILNLHSHPLSSSSIILLLHLPPPPSSYFPSYSSSIINLL